MRNTLLAFILAIGFTLPTAQGQSLFGVSYTASLPMGETQDFIDAMSWRGVSMEWRWFLQDQASLGLAFGWNVFHEKESGDFMLGEVAASGTQLRTINAFPILFTGHYYLANEVEFRPYLGAAVGTYRTLQRNTFGIYQVENNHWQFGFAPSVGATFPMGYNVMANLEVRYNYALRAGDSLANSYLGISLGLAWDQY